MTVKEAIEVGHVLGAKTMGQVASIMATLYSEKGLFTEEQWSQYCSEYEYYQTEYEKMYPDLCFENIKLNEAQI